MVNQTAEVDKLPELSTVILYLVPFGELRIRPSPLSSTSISPPVTVSLLAGRPLKGPMATWPRLAEGVEAPPNLEPIILN